MARIVFAQPPFFRLVGSHNDRGPLELAYISQWISGSANECLVVNLDFTGAVAHCTWKNLYERSHFLAQALTGESPILYEAAETILGLDPDLVFLSAGDSMTPWVDLGNGGITWLLGQLIRSNGIPVIGVGPRLAELSQDQRGCFTATISAWDRIGGLRSSEAVKLPDGDLDPRRLLPSIDDHSGSRYDVVITSLGCVKDCMFCDARIQPYQEIPAEFVARDVAQRPADRLDIGDAIFLPREQRLSEIRRYLDLLDSRPRSYSCELSVGLARPDAIKRLAEFGVNEVKIGVESADTDSIKIMGKRQSTLDIVGACQAVRDAGLSLTVYVLLGGPVPNPLGAAQRTLDLCSRLPANDFVINVWAYNRKHSKLTDTHFSWALVEEYGLGDIMSDFFKLQATHKSAIGRIINVSSPSS